MFYEHNNMHRDARTDPVVAFISNGTRRWAGMKRILFVSVLFIFMCLPISVFWFQIPGRARIDVALILMWMLIVAVISALVGYILFLRRKLAGDKVEKKPQRKSRNHASQPQVPVQVVYDRRPVHMLSDIHRQPAVPLKKDDISFGEYFRSQQ